MKKISAHIDRFSNKSTSWIGSTPSLVLHTIIFICFFLSGFWGFSWDSILLVLTTIVSLEAIYLAIFIQMTVNRNTKSLEEVEENIDEIQEDVDEIQGDIDEIQEDVGEIQEEVDEIVDEENSDDVDTKALEHIQKTLQKLLEEVDALKKQKE